VDVGLFELVLLAVWWMFGGCLAFVWWLFGGYLVVFY